MASATVPPEIATLDVLPGSGYTDACQFETGPGDRRSPAQWAAATFEGSPLRGFVRFGWRWGLLLRLAPPGTPGHVLGWPVQIVPGEPDVVVLAQESPLMSARLVFRAPPGTLQFSTYVRYTGIAGRVVWAVAAVLHRRLAPYLLKSAVRRSRRAGGGLSAVSPGSVSFRRYVASRYSAAGRTEMVAGMAAANAQPRGPRSGSNRDEAARLAVLHAADDLLVEHRFGALTVEAIARQAGVAKQTIYRWWPSKVDMLSSTRSSRTAANSFPSGWRNPQPRASVARTWPSMPLSGRSFTPR